MSNVPRVDEDEIQDLAEGAASHSTAAELVRCIPVEPLPAQTAIWKRAMAIGQAHGLQRPLSVFLRWVNGREDMCHGATAVDDAGRIIVTLDANATPAELFRTCLHESVHVHDFTLGARLSHVELEKRAIRYVMRVSRLYEL